MNYISVLDTVLDDKPKTLPEPKITSYIIINEDGTSQVLWVSK